MAGESKHPPAWSRFLRRIARPFLNKEEKDRIAAAIADMESRTTGEIHVHVVRRVGRRPPLEIVREKFAALGLEKTDGRNGVLIMVSHLDHKFAIWGDVGIHEKAGQPLWDAAAKTLVKHFTERRYAEGIVACVRAVGEELARHFPKTDDGPGLNQLPNDVTEE